MKNNKEAEAVSFIYNTALTNGLKMTAKLTNEAGYRTKKGNMWTDSTIKTLITNPKYKGYNVRNKFENVNLFTESKTKYVKKEEWIVQYNERIDPLVSEELWEEVQSALFTRCTNANRGKNASKYDTSRKIKCSKCGATYTRSVETRVADKPLDQHYMICAHKKKYTKAYCSSDNITIKMVDDFIEEQRKLYYLNIRTAIQLKLIYLQGQLASLNETNKNEKNNDFKVKNKKINELKNKMTNLMDNFINDNNSEAMQELISKKLQNIDIEIKGLEKEVSIINLDNLERETEAKKLSVRINKLKVDMESVPESELSREEWLGKVNKIIVLAKGKFDVEYNLE
ncbi:recombinase family protein [Clostridium algidicarnis]|uniref:recombinase family protein n=1 Tax=Clostridium algidicarnis TaxID=37659 RepID=UPI003144D944